MYRTNAASLNATALQASMLLPLLRGDKFQPYVQQMRWTDKMAIDYEQHKKTWQKVFRSHDVFFHRFELSETGDIRIIRANRIQVAFSFENWSQYSPQRKSRQLARFLKSDLTQGYESPSKPLCRLHCIKLSSKCFEWILTAHHALFDGRGRRILFEEFYRELDIDQHELPQKSPPAPGFEEFLSWHNKQDWGKSEPFWKQRLQSIDEPTPLEFDYDSPKHKSTSGFGTLTSVLADRNETAEFHRWSDQSGLSLNVLSQAAWGLLLASTSGKQNVVFAAPRHGRKSSIPQAEAIVGVLMNSVPVVANPGGDETTGHYLERIKRSWEDLRDHEHTPYPVYKSASHIAHYAELFTSYLGFESYALKEIFPKDRPVANVALRAFTGIPLSINLKDGKALSLEIIYDKSRFSHSSILRIRNCFSEIFRQLAGNPERKLKDIRLVPQREFKRILKLGTGPKPKLKETQIAKVFESIAARYPENQAMRCQKRILTYQELNETGNRLARLLKRMGVKHGDSVGIYLNRNCEAIISQLAVLKAGATYVPLNPIQPMERVERMLINSTPALIISESSFAIRLAAHREKLLLTEDWPNRLPRFSQTNLDIPDKEPAPAYIMYTSGSTGVPKGVVVPQAGVIRLVCKAGYARLSAKTISLQLTALSFDLSVFEIWGPLLNGGTCVLYPGEEPEFSKLRELIQTESINTLLLSASVFNAIMDNSPAILKGVGQLVIGAEALSSNHIKRALKALPKLTIINGYGPTEATALTNCHTVLKTQSAHRSVPIGKPINHSTSYILDKDGRLLPPGIPGELYVGGVGIAAGYRGDPQKTSEKFIPNPLPTRGDFILYRTGDRVFIHEDGCFDYIERFDDQLKIRGYRIEPGEIQATLRSLPNCKDCFVMAGPNDRGEQELKAYVVMAEGSHADSGELKKALRLKLPEYMIPTSFFFLLSLPLNASGKVDRNALSLLKLEEQSPSGKNARPSTTTETVIWNHWEELLGKPPAGLDADFFEAGGNSILATSLIYRIQQTFSLRLALGKFDTHTTVRQMAEWVDSIQRKPTGKVNPLILRRLKPRSVTPLGLKWRSFCIPDIMDPDSVKSLLITRAVILEGDLNPELLGKAMEQVIQANERLRTRGIVKNGKPMEKIEASVSLNFPIKDLTHLSEKQALKIADAVFRKESLGSMNMRYAPQLRVQLMKVARQKYFLSFVIQHAVADGFAVELFYAQTSLAYNALLTKDPNPLKPSAFSYREFETHLEQWLADGNEQRIRNFWRAQLRGIKPIPYPFLIENVPDDIGWNHMDHYRFQPTWRERIQDFTHANRMTTYVFFLTVAKLLVARYTHELDSYITSAVNGRTGNQQRDIFGDFACTILVRSRLQNHRSFLWHAEKEAHKLFTAMDHKYISANGINSPHKKQVAHAHSPFGQFQVIEGADTGDSLQLKGVTGRFISRRKVGALTRLGFIIRESKSHLSVTFAYAPMIFKPHSIERLKFNFQNFIKLILDNPQIRLDELPDLSDPNTYASPLTSAEKRAFIISDLGN